MNNNLKKWRWIGGMLTKCDIRVIEGTTEYLIGWGPKGLVDTVEVSGFEPDFSDPATAGCLPFLVRSRWRNPDLFCSKYEGADFDGWVVRGPDPQEPAIATGSTEVDAWLSALNSEMEEVEE